MKKPFSHSVVSKVHLLCSILHKRAVTMTFYIKVEPCLGKCAFRHHPCYGLVSEPTHCGKRTWINWKMLLFLGIRIAFLCNTMLAFMTLGMSFLFDKLWYFPYFCSKHVFLALIKAGWMTWFSRILTIYVSSQIRKQMNNPVNPAFPCIKGGWYEVSSRVFITRTCQRELVQGP